MVGKEQRLKSFDIDAFKAKWRALAAERGIDAQEGATAFQVVDVRADERKRTHYERARAAVYADAEKPKAWERYDNGYGEVDEKKVARQAASCWWAYAGYWRGGGRRINIHHPKWTKNRPRVTDTLRGEIMIIHYEVVADELLELLPSSILPTDVEAIENVRREARRLEGRGIEITRREDKSALWREAWQEDGEARKRQTAALVKFAPLRQLAFA